MNLQCGKLNMDYCKYHGQLPLFRVRSWNNGMRCVSFCILMFFFCNLANVINRQTGGRMCQSLHRLDKNGGLLMFEYSIREDSHSMKIIFTYILMSNTKKMKSSNGHLWGCQASAKSEHPKVVQNSSLEWVVRWQLSYHPINNPKVVKLHIFYGFSFYVTTKLLP